MGEHERRRFSRVRWQSDAVAELDGLRIRCRASDLSLGGVSMTSEWHAYAGKAIGVRFVVDGQPVSLRGVVAWSSGQGKRHAWGVRFTGAHASCIRRLYSFLRAHVARPERLERPANGETEPALLAATVPDVGAELGIPVEVSRAEDSPRPLIWATG